MSDQITYDNKVDLQVATNIANINKVTASDMNEIKNVVNSHADDIDELNDPSKWVSVGTTAPTDGRRVWFKYSKNLLDQSKLRQGAYHGRGDVQNRLFIDANYYLSPGTYTFFSNFDTSRYRVGVQASTNTYPNELGGNIYDSGWKTIQKFEFTISNYGYLGVSISASNGSDNLTPSDMSDYWFMICEGSYGQMIPYEPYITSQSINIDDTTFIGQEELVSVGVNQPDNGKRVWFAKGKNLFDKNSDIVNNYTFGETGDLVSTSDFFYQSKFIPVKPNTTYSCSGSRVVGSDSLRVVEYTASQTFIKRNYELYTFTTSSTTYFIRVSNYKTLLDTLQVEEGSTATSYETYIEPSINVDGEKWVDKVNDTGWIDITSYINTPYFSVRTGDAIKARRINNIVYFKGEIYCATALTSHSGRIMVGIPNEFRPKTQFSSCGVKYDLGVPYNIFIGINGDITVSESQNISVTPDYKGYQLTNLSGFLVD